MKQDYQPLFFRNYAYKLKKEAQLGTNLIHYTYESFPYEESELGLMQRVPYPEGLPELMNPNDDFSSAVALYEAYKILTPLEAQYDVLWITMAHTHLFSYLKLRWPLPGGTPTSQYVLDHWFERNLLRNPLSNLWWSVYLSVDPDRGEDRQYDLTRFLFRTQDFRTRTFGVSAQFRIKECAIGVLGFLTEHPELIEKAGWSDASRYIATHFNKLGAYKQLAILPRDYFYKQTELALQTYMRLHGRL